MSAPPRPAAKFGGGTLHRGADFTGSKQASKQAVLVEAVCFEDEKDVMDLLDEVEGAGGEELVHAGQDAKEEAVADAINKANGFE